MDEKYSGDLEDWRQLEHLLPICFAFLLPYISYGTAVFLAVLAVFHALYLSPRLVRVTTRPTEKERGFSVGKLLYALSVLILLLVFPSRLHIVAGVWGLLAAGDSVSNIAGRRWGQKKLPYNPEKSLVGLCSFWISGTLAAWILVCWNLPTEAEYSPGIIFVFCSLTALIAAFAESLPSTLDDNLVICWVGALCFVLLFSIENFEPQFAGPWQVALLVNLCVAALATVLRWISWKGTILAFLLGCFVYTAMDWPAYLVLCAFLVLGSLTTRLGKPRKEELSIAEGGGGRRGVSNVICNGIVPILIAAFSLWIKSPVLTVAFTAAVATAALDTVATEIGKWLGTKPINPVTFRTVKIGTPGGISWQGTSAGLVAALTVALSGAYVGWFPPAAVPAVLVGALTGGLFESVVASMMTNRPENTGSTLNIYNTLMGAFVSGLIWLIL